MKRSYTERFDQYPRARAAVLPGVVEHPVGRPGGRQLEVGVGKDDVGAVARRLRGSPVSICSAQPAMMRRPTSVEPVKHTLRTARWATKRSPATLPLPSRICRTPSGSAGLEQSSPIRRHAERGELGGLDDDGVAGGQRRCEAPPGDSHGEVPGHDDGGDTERLVEGDVDAPRHRDLPAAVALGRHGVVLDHVAHVAGLPARISDHVASVGRLDAASSSRWPSTAAAKQQSDRARSTDATARRARRRRRPGRWPHPSPRPCGPRPLRSPSHRRDCGRPR